ncbi:alpha-(1,3)-fucosyltransferase 10-like [Oscarella lobularis]|uniref:alpha-(1,3)-fucosyltransferase 10-like n=1 Tax=Oscarella lobularis TaxID=121494 RepID=UPI0033131492
MPTFFCVAYIYRLHLSGKRVAIIFLCSVRYRVMGRRLVKRFCLVLALGGLAALLAPLFYRKVVTSDESEVILELIRQNYGGEEKVIINQQNWDSYQQLQLSVRQSAEVEALPLSESETFIQSRLSGWDFRETVNPPKIELKASEKPTAMPYPEQNRFPILIWWTPFTGTPHTVKECGYGRCLFTQNRALQTHAKTRAFIWYATDLRLRDLPLPRKPQHDWALLHEESPKNNFPLVHAPLMTLFNHTCTFRRESSYPISLQYLHSLERLLATPLYSLTEKTRFKRDEGLASVLYIQSDCGTPSDRDRYVAKLMEYIKIDSLGRCLHNKDLPDKYVDPLTMDHKGFHDIVAKYKFTLAFENALCPDYMTEKLWRPLYIGSLPIYRGSPSVRDWMPNNKTIIVVDDFPTPFDLARYIKHLDNNDDEYLEYFAYKNYQPDMIPNKRLAETMRKRPWGVDSAYQINFVDGFECLICDRVYKELLAEARNEPPVKWLVNNSHYGCPTPHVALPELEPDEMLSMWISEHERQGYFAALGARDMITSGANSSAKFDDFVERAYYKNRDRVENRNAYELR